MILMVFSTASFAGPRYEIIDLGSLNGQGGRAASINNHGQITGTSSFEPGDGRLYHHAFIWENGVMTDIGTLPNGYSYHPISINDSGQIIGHYYGFEGQFNSFMYRPDTGMIHFDYRTTSQNNSNQMLCRSNLYETFLWDNSTITSMPEGGLMINNVGQVAGLNSQGQAYVYDMNSDQMQYYKSSDSDGSLITADINDLGQVVGYSYGHERNHAFLYDGQNVIDLINGPDRYSNKANAINNLSQIVGSSEEQAYIWQDGTLDFLDDLLDDDSGWQLINANDINDHGQIVGYGIYEGQGRAFLLNPVPEPATLSLVLLGGLLMQRRR
ncbi:MAG: PEP-CTERM sorting domain-containing protein [Phycisphaerae bacterium]|nr:PEP-CTERM sorting domain-containing protein [Phycisphaerae bacterium]